MYEQNNDLATGYIMGRDSTNNGYGNSMFGGDWSWWIIILLIFGWGGNGFGFGGNAGNNMNYELGRLATTNDVASGFSTSAIMSDLNDTQLAIQQGFSGVQNTLCQGFAGVNQSVERGFSTLGYNMATGFHGVDNAICTLGYQQAQGFNTLGHQISDCCCTTQRSIDSVKYENAKNTCDIINAGNANTRQILDFLTGEKISALQAENAGLKAQISNDRQSAYLINELKPCPIPAYITCNPNAPYGLGYGVNSCSCGCN
jgi:hypothetical protein